MASEIWKRIPGYDGKYEVSDAGRVRHPYGRLLLPRGKRCLVYLRSGGKSKEFQVGTLMLMAFERLPNLGEVGRHWDDNPWHNDLGNLLWGTRAENMADMVRNGHSLRGSNNRGAKLTEEAVVEIRCLLAMSVPQKEIVTRFCLSKSMVSMIAARRYWDHI